MKESIRLLNMHHEHAKAKFWNVVEQVAYIVYLVKHAYV